MPQCLQFGPSPKWLWQRRQITFRWKFGGPPAWA